MNAHDEATIVEMEHSCTESIFVSLFVNLKYVYSASPCYYQAYKINKITIKIMLNKNIKNVKQE